MCREVGQLRGGAAGGGGRGGVGGAAQRRGPPGERGGARPVGPAGRGLPLALSEDVRGGAEAGEPAAERDLRHLRRRRLRHRPLPRHRRDDRRHPGRPRPRHRRLLGDRPVRRAGRRRRLRAALHHRRHGPGGRAAAGLVGRRVVLAQARAPRQRPVPPDRAPRLPAAVVPARVHAPPLRRRARARPGGHPAPVVRPRHLARRLRGPLRARRLRRGHRQAWTNRAGVSWSLEVRDGALFSGPDCRYGALPIDVELSAGGEVAALWFGGGRYGRAG
jgi:hypothetical protein